MRALFERPEAGRVLAGVCAGLSDRYELDVTLLRLVAMLLVLASGIGALVYVTLWLVTPAEGSEARSFLQLAKANVRSMGADLSTVPRQLAEAWSRSDRNIRWPRPLSRRWIAIALTGAGGVILLASLGLFSWLSPARILGLVLLILGASVLIYQAPDWKR